MKTKTASLIMIATGLLVGSLPAQTSTVPPYVSYQGKVTDSAGAGLGTGAPVNRKVVFRLFDSPVGGTRLWTEEQTVTFSNGEFSVLLGNGTAATGTAAGESRPAIDTVFTSGTTTDRYLQITVDNGDNSITSADQPISPRQRMTSTAFTFRARSAESIAPGADLIMNNSADNGLGWYGSGRPFNGNSTINGPVLFGQGGGALGSKSGATQTTALRWDSSGVVSFPGTTTFTGAATFNGVTTFINAATFSGGISGNGSGITNINAGSITAGTLGNNVLISPSSISAQLSESQIPSLTNSKILSLDAGKLTGQLPIASNSSLIADGALVDSKISSLSASKLTGTLPDERLSVNVAKWSNGHSFTDWIGAPSMELRFPNGAPELVFSREASNRNASITLDPAGYLGISAPNGKVIFFSNVEYAQKVGIGTAASTYPLEVKGFGTSESATGWFYTKVAGGTAFSGSVQVSIRAEKAVMADHFASISDKRTKKDIGLSNTADDFEKVQKLRVSEYRMIEDRPSETARRKGFIAQELEEVIPEAVGHSSEFVPDIFVEAKQIAFEPGSGEATLSVPKEHSLKGGEAIRIMTRTGQIDTVVVKVPSKTQMVVAGLKSSTDKLFVYGRKVNDFRTVNYDTVFVTAVGALQELKKQKDAEVKALREENDVLRQRVAKMEAAEKARDTKLAEIEKLVRSADKAVARTVSLKKSEGAE